MKIVVIGGSGLIGSKTVARLRTLGHEVFAASPSVGVNAVTGEGLAEALEGAEVVVDVANSPSFEGDAAIKFFEASGRNLSAAEANAGVKHHVALSVVGTERLQDSSYFHGKLAQEKLIKASPIPYTIVRATQFFEFLGGIVKAGAAEGAIRLSPAAIQPMSSDDVADAVVKAAIGAPLNNTIEIGGPDRFRLDELVRKYLAATGDGRQVVTDPQASYFGVILDDRSLTPDAGAHLGATRLQDWLGKTTR